MAKWEGLADRLRQRISDMGYRNPAQFADAKGYRITYIYKWIGGTTPDRATLERLAADLNTTPEWLLFGDVVYERNRKRPKLSAFLLAVSFGLMATAPAKATPQPAVHAWPAFHGNAPYRKRRYSLATNWAPRAQLVVKCIAA